VLSERAGHCVRKILVQRVVLPVSVGKIIPASTSASIAARNGTRRKMMNNNARVEESAAPPKPPYPEHDCPACVRGEGTITPGWSSIVGSMPVHAPSGNICSKYISPEHLAILAEGKRRRDENRARAED
jgi:hypothetical protein